MDTPLPNKHTGVKMAKTEHEYNGAIIKQVPHTGLHESADTYGFTTPYVYCVVDEFDEPAMPELIHQKFWSPADAAMAWDHYCKMAPLLRARLGATWKNRMASEFTGLLAMRRRMPFVVEAIADLETKALEAQDFGESMLPETVLTMINVIKSLRYYG